MKTFLASESPTYSIYSTKDSEHGHPELIAMYDKLEIVEALPMSIGNVQTARKNAL